MSLLISVPQHRFKSSRGNIPVELQGEIAEFAKQFRVGDTLSLTGSLWVRQYMDRRQERQIEFRVMVETIEKI